MVTRRRNPLGQTAARRGFAEGVHHGLPVAKQPFLVGKQGQTPKTRADESNATESEVACFRVVLAMLVVGVARGRGVA